MSHVAIYIELSGSCFHSWLYQNSSSLLFTIAEEQRHASNSDLRIQINCIGEKDKVRIKVQIEVCVRIVSVLKPANKLS
jgi:hypothetical protein